MTQSPISKIIETVAYLHIEDQRLLLAKNKSHTGYQACGGKIEHGEVYTQALIRELREELQIDLIPESLVPYGIFEAQAYRKPAGTNVRIYCYTGEHGGEFVASQEVESIKYFTHAEYLATHDTAPAVVLIINDLKEKGLII